MQVIRVESEQRMPNGFAQESVLEAGVALNGNAVPSSKMMSLAGPPPPSPPPSVDNDDDMMTVMSPPSKLSFQMDHGAQGLTCRKQSFGASTADSTASKDIVQQHASTETRFSVRSASGAASSSSTSQRNLKNSSPLFLASTCVEIVSGMKASITPFTEPLYELFMQALRDEEAEVNSNAAFAIGMLVEQSGVDLSSRYLSILGALRPLFSLPLEAPSAKITARSNAAGAVARMMIRKPDGISYDEVLPVFLQALPLQNDYLENAPVFRCILYLFLPLSYRSLISSFLSSRTFSTQKRQLS